MKRFIAATLIVLLLLVAGFLFGGTYGRLTIPAGSGLAGGGIAAMYALFGAAVGAVIGIVVGVKANDARLWPFAGAALAVAVAARIALQVTPLRTLPPTSYEPPPAFEPEYNFSLMADPDAPRSEADPLSLTFDRLDVGTRIFTVRALPRDSVTMCTADLSDGALMERVRVAAVPVRAACASGTCAISTCADCAPWKLLFMQAGDTSAWYDISSTYLASTAQGRELTAALEEVFARVQPWKACTN
jgi:hypothetical protein